MTFTVWTWNLGHGLKCKYLRIPSVVKENYGKNIISKKDYSYLGP